MLIKLRTEPLCLVRNFFMCQNVTLLSFRHVGCCRFERGTAIDKRKERDTERYHPSKGWYRYET
jgi:hypothetical protein